MDIDSLTLFTQEHCSNEIDPPAYGICFVDTATGEFNLASFVDDIDRTQFETLIMQVKPKEIVHEKVSILDLIINNFRKLLEVIVYYFKFFLFFFFFFQGMLSKRSQRILKTCIDCPIWTGLIPEREFWDANATWDEIRFSRYFSNKSKNSFGQDDVNDESMEGDDNEYKPGIFRFVLSKS
jgi:DNA mismatch repair protein MSH6